jgi:Na+-translocating ferredoxin:NAD+ oxidoreductase RnfD subunit
MVDTQPVPSNTNHNVGWQSSLPAPTAKPDRLGSTGALAAVGRRRATPWNQPRKFIRTPKGYLLIALSVLLLLTVPNQGPPALDTTLAAVAVAALTDVAFSLMLSEKLIVPTSAVLTGLIVGMVLSPQESITIAAAVAGLAIAAKHLVRTTKSHIFNPAALALVLAPSLFGSGESWWGAAVGLPMPLVVAVLIVGMLTADRVNKMPQVFSFLSVYFGLITAMAWLHLGDPIRIASFYRDPFLNSVLFFAFFMLTDPPTSPVRFKDQVIFGSGVALAALAIELHRDTVTYLLLALLPANAWWAWRRLTAKRTPRAKAPRRTNWLETLVDADQ